MRRRDQIKKPLPGQLTAEQIEHDCRLLQSEIDRHFASYPIERIASLRLGAGAEVTDLSSLAPICVDFMDGSRLDLEFVTVPWIEKVLASRDSDSVSSGIYTVGDPTVVVTDISGSSIVRGVRRYLEVRGELSEGA